MINVDELWAAAAVPVSAMMWVMLSVERGALQGFQRYQAVALSIVGEARCGWSPPPRSWPRAPA